MLSYFHFNVMWKLVLAVSFVVSIYIYIYLIQILSLNKKNKYSATYRFSRACMLSNSTGVDGSSQHQANFILPDINKLALEAKSGSLAILLVSFGMHFYEKID